MNIKDEPKREGGGKQTAVKEKVETKSKTRTKAKTAKQLEKELGEKQVTKESVKPMPKETAKESTKKAFGLNPKPKEQFAPSQSPLQEAIGYALEGIGLQIMRLPSPIPRSVAIPQIMSMPNPNPVPQPAPQPAPSPNPSPIPSPQPNPIPKPTPKPQPQPSPSPAPRPNPEPKPSPMPFPMPMPNKPTATVVMTKPKEKLMIKRRYKKGEIYTAPKGTITFQSAIGWVSIEPPYKEQDNLVLSAEAPENAKVVSGRVSAYQTIQSIGGDVNIVLRLDLGNQDVTITNPTAEAGKAGAIKFKRDMGNKTKGDITIKGLKRQGKAIPRQNENKSVIGY